MKKILALMFVLSIGLANNSCSSDDDDPAVQFTIVGTWKITGKYINNTPHDITDDCSLKGDLKFVNGGAYVEDIWIENETMPCHLYESIGGNWMKNGDSYTIVISTPDAISVLPETFTPELTAGNINEFKISATSLGTTTTLVFSKQ